MPWCRNDRFTTSVYSLLDPWLPGRPNLKGRDEDPAVVAAKRTFLADRCGKPPEEQVPLRVEYLTELPWIKVESKPDLVLDASHLSFSTGSIAIPVVRPIQIHYNLADLRAPAEHEADATIPVLPDLPPIPSIANEVDTVVPKIMTGSSPASFQEPPVQPVTGSEDYCDIAEVMTGVTLVIRGMEESYGEFWTSLLHPWEVLSRDRRLTNCSAKKSGLCKHVEMDLVERFTRIGVRPAVQLIEDAFSIGRFRDPNIFGYTDCPEKDWACVLLHEEQEPPRRGWKISGPTEGSGEESVDRLRQKNAEEFINEGKTELFSGEEEELFPYNQSPEDILPSFHVPSVFPLHFTGATRVSDESS